MANKKWQEITLDFFVEIFNLYWSKEIFTLDKVLEVQNLKALKEEASDVRLYLGSKLNIYDYREYNKLAIDVSNFLDNMYNIKGCPLFGENNLSTCILEKGPRITPYNNKIKEHYNLIWFSFFGGKTGNDILDSVDNPISSWYTKKDGKFLVENLGKTNIPDSEKYIRVREFSFSDWKKMIDDYCNSEFTDSELLLKDDDLPKDSIILKKTFGLKSPQSLINEIINHK